MITVALVDDHTLIRNALSELINRFENFEIVLTASNGKEFIDSVQNLAQLPSIVLLDINMPVMDGYETCQYITQHYPQMKVLALTVEDHEDAIIKMLRFGAVGYLLKDAETPQLQTALLEVVDKGYYHSEMIAKTLLGSVAPPQKASNHKSKPFFQGQEEEFLKLACSELTYKEIADKMCLSPRTVDGYRESLFEKLEIKSRVGLVMFAIKNGFVRV